MKVISKTSSGINYLVGILKTKAKTVTKVVFYKIPHNNKEVKDICLKVGRYKIVDNIFEEVENITPKSELTLDNEELNNLVEFIGNNYKPLEQDVKKYIPLDEKFNKDDIQHIRAIFDNPDKKSLLSFIADNKILPDSIVSSLQYQAKIDSLKEFEEMLKEEAVEYAWQEWFKKNDWILGTEFVKILDEREIDTENIADYLMQAYDGFLDIIEIKRPVVSLSFWAISEDHDNPIPSTPLIKAITQASKYIYDVEREVDSIKFQERVKGVKVIKPRCVLIFGRSNNWSPEQKEAYRILNSSYHNLTILTYDHVLARAKRILGVEIEEQLEISKNIDEIPF